MAIGFRNPFVTSSDKRKALKIFMVYPNREAEIIDIKYDQDRFTHGDRTYIIDEKSIYRFKDKNLCFYHYGVSGPLLISKDKIESMSPQELKAIIETKAIKDLLTSAETFDWTFWVACAAAAFSLVQLLISFGVIHVGTAAKAAGG